MPTTIRVIRTDGGPAVAARPAPEPQAPREGPAAPRRMGHNVPFLAAIAFVVISVVAIVFSRYTEIGTLRVPETRPIAMRDIVLMETPDDTLHVIDARTGKRLLEGAPGTEGFIRGTMRGLGRLRMQRGGPVDAPWRVISWSDGSVTLSDTTTGQSITLNAFGASNLASFSRFLDTPPPGAPAR